MLKFWWCRFNVVSLWSTKYKTMKISVLIYILILLILVISLAIYSFKKMKKEKTPLFVVSLYVFCFGFVIFILGNTLIVELF